MPGSNDNMGTSAGGASSSDPLRGFDTDGPPNASLSLLVRMPDGKKRQVEVPPNASVRQLRSSIAANIGGDFGIGTENSLADQPPEDWDLRFGESSLQDEHTLDHYNIPNVVDHANAVLKAIRDNNYPTEGKKLEALEGAYQVVAGVSRGEQDMTRLINSAFNEGTENFVLDPSTSQPSIQAMRRSRPSRIPSINLSQLPPPLPVSSSRLSGVPSMPSTPRDLLLRLSHSRPDLYKFPDNNDKPSNISISPRASNQPTITTAPPPGATGSPVLNPESSNINNADLSGPNNDRITAENQQQRDAEAKQDNGNHPPHNEGSGELKRGNTWIDYLNTIGKTIGGEEKQEGNGSSEGEAEKSDVEGDSEDEPLGDEPDNIGNKSHMVQNAFGSSSNTGGNSNHKTEPQLDQDKNENPNSNVQSISNSESPSHENGHNQMDESRNENSMSRGEMSQDSDGSPKHHDSDQNSSLTKSEQKQVIGLEPQTLSGAPEVKVPKKRGRKRKNPHLTEEQRKQQRQAQNRESAKLSRLRRKNMTIRYERRVNILEVENTNLRDTVSALQKRLEMLQNLLTITVRPSAGHLPGASRTGSAAPVGLMPPVSGQLQMGAPVVPSPSVMGTHPGLGSQPQVGLQPSISTGHQLNIPHPQLSTQSRLGPQPQLGSTNPFGATLQRNTQVGVGLPHGSAVAGSVPMTSSAPPVSQPGLANGGSVARSSASRQNPLANLEYRNY